MAVPLSCGEPVSPRHLGSELVRAEAKATEYAAQCDVGRAEQWSSYRERVLGWRYVMLRGRQVRWLQLCPACGYVPQLEPGELVCLMCGTRWIGCNP